MPAGVTLPPGVTLEAGQVHVSYPNVQLSGSAKALLEYAKTPAGKLALAKQMADAGLLDEKSLEPEDDEDIPEEALLPPDGSSSGADGAGPTRMWGGDLPGRVRLSADYRLAIYREGEDYRLVEMVREGGVWRERVVSPEPEGFDVVESRLLQMAVEVMSP